MPDQNKRSSARIPAIGDDGRHNSTLLVTADQCEQANMALARGEEIAAAIAAGAAPTVCGCCGRALGEPHTSSCSHASTVTIVPTLRPDTFKRRKRGTRIAIDNMLLAADQAVRILRVASATGISAGACTVAADDLDAAITDLEATRGRGAK